MIQKESQKTPYIKIDVTNFDSENILLDLLAIEWDEVILLFKLGFAVFGENECGFAVLAFSAVCGFQRF